MRLRIFLRYFLLSISVVVGVLFTLPLGLWANTFFRPPLEEDLRYTQELDWLNARLYLNLQTSLPDHDRVLESRHTATIHLLESYLPFILQETVTSLPVGSDKTFADFVHQNPNLLKDISQLAKVSILEQSRLSEDRQNVNMRYRLDFFPYLSSLLIKRQETLHFLPHQIPNTGSGQYFSGLVVYIKSKLPLAGAPEQETNFHPSLFPRILNEDLEVVIDTQWMNPLFLHRWGLVAYSNNFRYEDYKDRIGDTPLLSSARAVYGIHRGDLILTNSDLNKLFSKKENRSILEEGRILFILEDFLHETL